MFHGIFLDHIRERYKGPLYSIKGGFITLLLSMREKVFPLALLSALYTALSPQFIYFLLFTIAVLMINESVLPDFFARPWENASLQSLFLVMKKRHSVSRKFLVYSLSLTVRSRTFLILTKSYVTDHVLEWVSDLYTSSFYPCYLEIGKRRLSFHSIQIWHGNCSSAKGPYTWRKRTE